MKLRIMVALCGAYTKIVKTAAVIVTAAAFFMLLGTVGIIETGGVPTAASILLMIFGPSIGVLLLGYGKYLEKKYDKLDKTYSSYAYRENKKYRLFCYRRDGIVK